MISKEFLVSHRIKNLGYSSAQKIRQTYRSVSKVDIDFIASHYDSLLPVKISEFPQPVYVDIMGLKELRKEIARLESERTGFCYDERNVIITSGSISALQSLLFVLCDISDIIFITKPYWYNYPLIAKTVSVYITNIMDEYSKGWILNNPSYCGTCLTARDIDNLFSKYRANNLEFVIADNIFSDFWYEHPIPDIYGYVSKEELIIVNSPSKSWNAGGLRVGYCVADHYIIDELAKYQLCSTYGASLWSQKAYLEILKSGAKPDLDKARRKRDFMVSSLNEMGFKCETPMGGTGLLAKVDSFLGFTFLDSIDIVKDLLFKKSIAVGDGLDFGSPNSIYLCYCIPWDILKEGIRRLKEWAQEVYTHHKI